MTVKEALEKFNAALDKVGNEINPCFDHRYIGLDEELQNLIAAAKEEGAEKGARRERRRLKAARVVGYDRTEPPYSGQLCYCIPHKAFSVLSPTEPEVKP